MSGLYQTAYTANYLWFLYTNYTLIEAGKYKQKHRRLQSVDANCQPDPSYSNWGTVKLQGGALHMMFKVIGGILAVQMRTGRHR